MKKVTLFESLNGELFKNIDDCKEDDYKFIFVENIISQLKEIPNLGEDNDFRTGEYFIQQDLKLVKKLKKELLVFIRKYNSFWLIDKMIEGKEFVHPSWVFRGLESDRVFSMAFSRFANIDFCGREWSCSGLAYPSLTDD